MKKTTIIFAIILCFSLALSACGNNSTKDTPPTQTSGTKESAKDTTQHPTSNNDAEDTSAPVSSTDDSSITGYTLSQYRNYSDGVAWVKGVDEIWRCIDKTGNILFDLEAGTEPVSDFINGVAVIETDSEFSGITTENKVVASLLKSDYKETKCIANNLIFVHKQTKTLEGNTDEYGLFDMSSNDWRIPLGTSFYHSFTLQDAGLLNDYIYIWAIDYSGGGVGTLYAVPASSNVKELTIYEQDLGRYYYIMFDGINNGVNGINHGESGLYTTLSGMSINERLSFYEDSPYPIIISDFAAPRFVVTMDNNLLFVCIGNENEQGSKTGIYDISGNLIADLSEYTFVGADAVGGQLLAVLRNPDGAYFTAAFDKTGRMMFEAMEGLPEHAFDDVFYLNNGFYDMNGSLVYEIEENLVRNGFQDGVLWVLLTKDSGVKQLTLIDKNGETLFETGYGK